MIVKLGDEVDTAYGQCTRTGHRGLPSVRSETEAQHAIFKLASNQFVTAPPQSPLVTLQLSRPLSTCKLGHKVTGTLHGHGSLMPLMPLVATTQLRR